jgi:type II secretory pathway component GspD/PulD (secretin)
VDGVSLPRRPLAPGWWLALVLVASPALAQAPPTVPLTQLDVRGAAADLDNRAFTLTFAQAVPIKDLLLLLVRGTNLSVVPDPSIGGSFVGELKNVTVRQALDSILPPLGLAYTVDGGFIRVRARAPDTRIFDINYIASDRSAASTLGAAAGPGGVSRAAVSTSTTTDLFSDLAKGIQGLLSEHATFNVDRQAGLVQVTDFPERLDRVADYLDTVEEHVHRQVVLEARIVEVELKDAKAPGVDWQVITTGLIGAPGAAPPARPAARPLTGLRITDVGRFMALLADQGRVATIQTARLVTLQNQPALVRSDALTLSVTPQIAADGVVMLSLTPVLESPARAEADTLARVADGETLVLSGFTRDRDVKERTNLGLKGGWFGRGTTTTHKRVELLILLTPRIL